MARAICKKGSVLFCAWHAHCTSLLREYKGNQDNEGQTHVLLRGLITETVVLLVPFMHHLSEDALHWPKYTPSVRHRA